MPMPKRASVDEYFALLDDVQRPHLETLREVSASGTDQVSMRGITAIIQREFQHWPFDDLARLVRDEAAKLGFVPLKD